LNAKGWENINRVKQTLLFLAKSKTAEKAVFETDN
jgi:hypothetical protein